MTEIKSIMKKSVKEYQFLINNILDIIVEIDLDGTFTYLSPQVYDILGYTPEEVIGNQFFSYIHPDDMETIIENFQRAIGGEDIVAIEYKIRHKKGHYVYVFAKGSLVKINNKAKIIGVLRDITEKKKAERELKEINQLKTELIERTSHELKTPLISIKGFTDLLLELHKEKFDDDVLSILSEISNGTEQLETIINRLLESSLLESGKIQFKPSKEDLSFLIRFSVKNLRGLAKTRNHFINLDIYDKLILNFEKERIYEVITHLIINAIKYTPPYGEIKIKTEKLDDRVIISVQDNGIGLLEDEKKKLFKQFGKIERYGQGWDIGIEGTGMGLYTSKKIVELHGGEIWVESEGRNKGAKFCFSLPLNKD
ncbi:MAG: PAS domain-containing sensor histidine kinase [Candidatus Lokiarchaeota archaeon]|nr:PAS domain-containing sensor histidine kinase [Candidatus Lokiarchaeota archaeon]